MNTSKKHRHLNILIAVNFILSVVIGMVSNFIPAGDLQKLFWGVSAFFVIIGAALLASKLSREDHDIPAAGFGLLVIGEAMAYGFIATHDAGQDQYGAVIIIFVPGLLLISIYSESPVWIRLLGFVSAVSFAILTFMIYLEDLTPTSQAILSGLSYSAFNFMLLGWGWLLYRNKV